MELNHPLTFTQYTGKEPDIVVSVEDVLPEPLLEERLDETQPADKIKPKKKKMTKKVKKDEQDEYIKMLLEQEIPKTELEKYEKIEFEKPEKKPEAEQEAELVPIKIERKEQKPTQVKIISVDDLPKPVKLKPKKPKQLEKPAEVEPVQKPKLKSRITHVEIEHPLTLTVKVIGAVRQCGELSRNIEEAEKLIKTKVKKFKPSKKRKDSLERPELEKYEKYESSSDESMSKKEGYQRAKKDIPEEEVDNKTLKLGKGKSRPDEDDIESVKLKPVPHKDEATEELFEPKPKKVKLIEFKSTNTLIQVGTESSPFFENQIIKSIPSLSRNHSYSTILL